MDSVDAWLVRVAFYNNWY